MFDFFYGNEAEQFAYYTIPKILFTDDKFKNISCYAKTLYGILLNRMSLSVKHNWVDENGFAYIYFRLETAQEYLNVSKNTATKIFSELEKIGLIIRKKQGRGMPARIYVMNFAKSIEDDDKNADSTNESAGQTSKMAQHTSNQNENTDSQNLGVNNFTVNSESQNMGFKTPNIWERDSQNVGFKTPKNREQNDNEINNTELSYNNLSISHSSIAKVERESASTKHNDGRMTDNTKNENRYCDVVEAIKSQIDYDSLIAQQFSERSSYVNLVVDIIAEAYSCRDPDVTLKINGIIVSMHDVASKFKLLNSDHIQYVYDKVMEVAEDHKIKNIKSYVRNCLYNAPSIMGFDYDADIAYNFANNDSWKKHFQAAK